MSKTKEYVKKAGKGAYHASRNITTKIYVHGQQQSTFNKSQNGGLMGLIVVFIFMAILTMIAFSTFNMWFIVFMGLMIVIFWYMGYGIGAIMGMCIGAILWFIGIFNMIWNFMTSPFWFIGVS